MSLFSAPACLQCGSSLPLRVLWAFARDVDRRTPPGDAWLTRHGLFRREVGIQCPNCGAKFQVGQARIRLVRFAIWALVAAVAFCGGLVVRRGYDGNVQYLALPFVALLVGAAFALTRWLTPRMVQLRPMQVAGDIAYPLAAAYQGTLLGEHAHERRQP